MIKALLKWILREELENIRNEAEDDLQELREFILGSLSISFTSIRKRIDDVEALALATCEAVDRLEDGHNLLSGAHNHLDDIVMAQSDIISEIGEDFQEFAVNLVADLDTLLDGLEDLDERVLFLEEEA